jgi:HSP20 family protein
MTVRDLIPWGRGNRNPAIYRDAAQNPFLALHRQVNRLFDDVTIPASKFPGCESA